MGNFLIKNQRRKEDATQARHPGRQEIQLTQHPEPGVAVPNFESAQCPNPRPEPFTANTNDITTFNRDIKVLSIKNEWVLATALLDTQCHKGNWISRRLARELGKLSSISTNFVDPELTDANGASVYACGVIDLHWKWHPYGIRNHLCRFFVFPNSDHLDVLFGVEHIVSERLLQVNELAFPTLVKHIEKKKKKGDKAAVAHAQKRQQEGKQL